MRLGVILLLVPASLLAGVLPAEPQRVRPQTFDAMATGAAPPGFTLSAMRQQTPGVWVVRRAGADGWLVHAADPASHGFTMAIAPGEPQRDVVVSARVRLAGGTRTGGLVWRYLDAAHYYAALLDVARGEISMYRVSHGNRIKLEHKGDLELEADAWHVLKAVHDDDLVYVMIDGIRVLEDRSGRGDRSGPPGRVGLVATGDSEAWFDDLRIDSPRRRN